MTENPSKGFDTQIQRSLAIEEVDEEQHRVSFTMTVTEALCNRNENLHGGAAATIMDCITSYALLTISREGFWENIGVSRTLSTTYLRPILKGTKIRLEGEVVHAGRKLASLTGRISRFDDGEVCVTCTHDKAVIEAKSNL